jgi:copper chaperone CopZ
MCSCQTNAGTVTVEKPLEGVDFLVEGMTCQSCVSKVTNTVRGVPGVADVEVDLDTGRLTVAGEADVAVITAAVTGAGYSISQT